MENYSVKNSDIPEVFKMWGDIFTFQKKYYNAQKLNSDRSNEKEFDEFWKQCLEEADVINKRYNTRLCKDIITAVLDDISARMKF